MELSDGSERNAPVLAFVRVSDRQQKREREGSESFMRRAVSLGRSSPERGGEPRKSDLSINNKLIKKSCP